MSVGNHPWLLGIGGGIATTLALLASGCTTTSKSKPPTASATRTPTATPCPSNWSAKANMPTSRGGLAAVPVTIGGVAGVLALGGSGTSSSLPIAEFYNSATNSWSAMASMNTGREYLAAAPVTVSGVAGVLAVGGYGQSGFTSGVLTKAEFYNPVTNSWSNVAPMTIAREFLAAAPVTVSGTAGVLVVGGYDGSADLSYAEFYNPTTNFWTTLPSMPTVREGLAASSVTVGGTAGVLVAGGSNSGSGYLATAEFYNPTTDSWTMAAPMLSAREWLATAPVTVNGTTGVLVAGGYGARGTLTSVEFYNPVTNGWSLVACMPSSREAFAAAPLTISGAPGVFVTGGDNGVNLLPTPEFFAP